MDNKERKNLLVFGYGLAAIITGWSLLYWRKHPQADWILGPLVLAAGLAVTTFWRLEALKPIYKNWMRVAHMIGQVVTTVILSVIFYLVFTPVAIILRVMSKDLLDRRLELHKESYWQKRAPAAEKIRYTKQF